jgi:DNA primase
MDRFRGRIVIPIFDATGKNVLGFGGRILKNDEGNSEFKAPKYLNSPESLVFKKQNILYGQHMAKKSVRYWADQGNDASRPVVIVEGYMDAIALWQAGIREAVASMGTALTSNQLEAAAAIAGTRNGKLC